MATPRTAIHVLLASNVIIAYAYLLNLVNSHRNLISDKEAIEMDDTNIKNAYIPETIHPVES